jgi:hypothetical protein
MFQKLLIFLLIINFSYVNAQRPPVMEVALVMDLSGSTNGLLNDIRNNYYFIINEVQSMKPVPQLKIAVIAYGRPSFGSKTNYVRVISDFTQEYDKIQYELILLKTSIEKGDHYVGDAVYAALRNLSWSPGNTAIKVIYLVGNGMINTSKFIKNDNLAEEAKNANIIINTLYTYYGSKKIPKEILGWRSFAENTLGIYAEASINRKQPNPQLAQNYSGLNQINNNLNASLMPFKKDGNDMMKMTNAIDRYHRNVGGYSFEDRIFFKTTPYYQNSINSWDLISTSYIRHVDVASVNKAFLPADYQKIDEQNLKNAIYAKRIERARVQKEAAQMLGGPLRHKIINERLIELDLHNSNTLTRVIVNNLRELAAKNGLTNP